MKRQRRIPGSIVKIPLDEKSHAYAMVLDEPLFAFFDVRSTTDLPVGDIVEKPVLFRIWVMNHAVTRGRWEVVGKGSIPAALRTLPTFFKQDALDGSVSLYRNGQETPATAAQAEGLECAAVWEPEHAEDRLRDHFAGRANKWVQSLALRAQVS